MRELQKGLWQWGAPHPDWGPDEPWAEEVSSHALDDGSRLLLSLGKGVTRGQVVAQLRPLFDRSVELVLPAHGAPADRAALERALA